MASIGGVQIALDVVELLKQGNRNAQEQVFEALATPVYSMALRVLGDVHEAEDVTQDTFVDVFTKAHTIRQPSQFVGWVRTLAVNRCFMRLRSPWHRRRLDIEPPEGETQDPTDDIIDVEQALAKMDPKTRLVVWLYCVEGYTHQEIGKILRKSTSYSKVIISRLEKTERDPQQSDSERQETSDASRTAIAGQWSTLLCP